jgi:hypothetical protein
MRLREFMIGTVFMSIALVSAKGMVPPVRDDEVAEPDTSMPLPVEPSPLIARDKVLGSAYYDTLSILSTNNACSDFFGGSAASVDVFNRFIGKVRKDYFSPFIGMRMTGTTTNMFNATTKIQYRLFERVLLNANGVFYRRRTSNVDPDLLGVGSFKPNTKEVRVLILLHELGHVMKGQDGNWLLPDDGQDEDLSRRNSRKIEEVCGDEIKKLSKAKPVNLAAHKQPANSIGLVNNLLKAVN